MVVKLLTYWFTFYMSRSSNNHCAPSLQMPWRPACQRRPLKTCLFLGGNLCYQIVWPPAYHSHTAVTLKDLKTIIKTASRNHTYSYKNYTISYFIPLYTWSTYHPSVNDIFYMNFITQVVTADVTSATLIRIAYARRYLNSV